jgi:hypothetical protein
MASLGIDSERAASLTSWLNLLNQRISLMSLQWSEDADAVNQ